MYTHWLSPSRVPLASRPSHTIGTRLSAAPAAPASVALIGLHPAAADGIREHLFDLSWDFDALRLADLGNLRNRSVDFTIPLLRELYASGILPVLVGGDDRQLAAQYLAFAELNRQIGLCVVDSGIRLNDGRSLDRAVHREHSPAFHLAHIGSQRQLVDPDLDGLFLKRHFERFTLGQSRGELSELEPAIRDADVFALHLGSLLSGEAPAQEGCHPSGFSLQEAGQLTYYAGNSDRVSSFGIYGYAPQDCTAREQRLTQAAEAQLIWYFLHGVSRRSGDFPVSTDGLLEYVVDSKLTDRLTFWRSSRSNRWWVEIPVARLPDGEARNRLVACSYGDYLQVSRDGNLPERIHLAFSRY